MADEFAAFSDLPINPARNAAEVTPSDADALANVPKGLYIGGGGDIACRLVDDAADVTFASIPAGTVLPIRVSHVRATGTSATNIVALI
jgi:hypothetical protein